MKKKFLLFAVLILVTTTTSFAQHQVRFIVKDSLTSETIVGATIVLANTTNGAVTDINGQAVVDNVTPGLQEFHVSLIGYKKTTVTINIPSTEPIVILLSTDESQLEEVIISTTRTNSRIEDAPVKVEVLGLEDLNEENSIKPGNVSSILGDVSSIQVQQLSAASNNAVIRMQGLDGKYTLLLRDGMPSFGSLSGGLSIMQIPPLDLKQIEIIKGPSSTLNGGGAIAGLINFISKLPSDSAETSVTLNQSTLRETNLNTYLSSSKGKWGYTLLGSSMLQKAVDVNKDSYSDVPSVNSFLIHPQVFYSVSKTTKFKLGITSTFENNMGGHMDAIKSANDSLNLYYINNQSDRQAADIVLNGVFKNKNTWSLKSSISQFNRSTITNSSKFKGKQWNSYSELFYSIPRNAHQFIFGGNFTADDFRKLSTDRFPLQRYSIQTMGLFSQYALHLENKINLEAGLRGDYVTSDNWFVLPSVAVLFHLNKGFSIRLNGGSGYKIPDLLEVAQTSFSAGQNYLEFSGTIKPERSIGGTAEWNYKRIINELSFYFNQTFFITRIDNSITEQSNSYIYFSSSKPVTTKGIDNYVRISLRQYSLYAGYTYTLPKNNLDSERPYISYTPLHRAALTIVDEVSEHWRVGFETSYNGFQYRDDGSKTRDYYFLAASLQYKTGHFTFVFNGENLLDFRQSKYEAIVNGSPSNPQFIKLWAPIDGRVLNLSVLLKI